MRQRIQWAFACLTVVMALAVILEAQLWVSSGTGVTTAGDVEVGGTFTAGAGAVSGAWTFDGTAAPIMTSATSNAGAIVVLGRSSDNNSRIFFQNNANDTNYGSIGASATSSGTLLLSAAGAVSFASNVPVGNAGRYNSASNQPSFFAYNSVEDDSVSNGAIEFDTEVYDTTNSLASLLGATTFTAPVTGRYLFCTRVVSGDSTTAAVSIRFQLASTFVEIGRFATDKEIGTGTCLEWVLTAAQTAAVVVNFPSGTTDIGGGTNPVVTWFSGQLMP